VGTAAEQGNGQQNGTPGVDSARRPSCKNGCQPLYCVMRAMS
jgi:hypothetical protein